ncbi:MAG TPA: hypothetical protein VNT54_13710, partial [Solirubrobacteraceae bacterium]|nr:hypothetical protein [Solirubrobacteraceae bacterium]
MESASRLAELSLQAARQAGSLAVSVVRAVAEPVLGRPGHNGSHHSTTPPPPPATPTPAPEREQREPERPRAAATAATAPAPPPAPPRPTAVA